MTTPPSWLKKAAEEVASRSVSPALIDAERALMVAQLEVRRLRDLIEKTCNHPLARVKYDSYTEHDTLGNPRGGVYMINCGVCRRMIWKTKV
jgi:hypothetical protein